VEEEQMMTNPELAEAVLRLPFEERAALTEQLLASLAAEPNCPLDPAWIDEITARSDAVHAGTAKLSDWRGSLQRVRTALAARKIDS
jgi:putative addiction module component (TIGR02574 family)